MAMHLRIYNGQFMYYVYWITLLVNEWSIWNSADPTTRNKKRPSKNGPTGKSSSFFYLEFYSSLSGAGGLFEPNVLFELALLVFHLLL
jgi:hypothetical protein